MSSPVICLMGPTAIGKTDLACILQDKLPIEIVSVDSTMVYKELNIGAAKPSLETLKKYPHHLINCCNLKSIYSVADFCQDAKKACDEIWKKGNVPLLVGGTMMYFHAFQNGLASLPDANILLRSKIETEAKEKSWEELHEQLKTIDPKTHQRIHANDRQRIMRAHEIYQLTGKSWGEHLLEAQKKVSMNFINIGLFPEPRSWLHERIEKRLYQMLDEGFLEEVESILCLDNINLEHPALKSVGYRQAIDFINGYLSKEEWPMKAVFATRQLAKRQMTWLRSFHLDFTCNQPNNKIEQEIIAQIQKIIDNV